MTTFKDRVPEIGKEGWRSLEVVDAGTSSLTIGQTFKAKVNFADNPTEPGTMFAKVNIASRELILQGIDDEKITTSLAVAGAIKNSEYKTRLGAI